MWQRIFKQRRQAYVEQVPSLQHWLKSDRGAAMLARQKQLLADELPYLFGYHGALLGLSYNLDLLDLWPLGYKFGLCIDGPSCQDSRAMVGHGTEWPVQSHSLDVVLMHHMLEFYEHPHQILREAARSIIPGGRLVIIGFNPWSLWGFYRLGAVGRDRCLRSGRFISSRRLQDWLKLLGFGVEKVVHGAPLQPLLLQQNSKLEQYCHRWALPVGSFYIMLAAKETAGLTPIRPGHAISKPRFVAGSLQGSSSRRKPDCKL